MAISRRFLLRGLVVAPAVIAIDNLMAVKPWIPVLYGDGIHDDWEGLQALLNGDPVDNRSTTILASPVLPSLGFTSVGNKYSLSRPLVIPNDGWRRDQFIGDQFLRRGNFPADEALIILEGSSHPSVWMNTYVEGSGNWLSYADVDNPLTS